MRLTPDDARQRLVAHDHGVLSTLHTVRGIDSVPVVYAVEGNLLGIPIDTVKPKLSTNLQREANAAADPRATLLVDHWNRDDWSNLWWVRVHLTAVKNPDPDATSRLADALASRYPQYADKPFARIMVFEIASMTGWSAAEEFVNDV